MYPHTPKMLINEAGHLKASKRSPFERKLCRQTTTYYSYKV